MSAEKGNKYAEKWTLEKAIELSEKALNAVNEHCYFIAEIAEECEVYRQLFNYILNKFSDNEEVFLNIKRMYNKCESMIFRKAAEQKIDKTLAIFTLKSLHGLMETSKQVTTNTNINTELKPITTEELNDAINRLESGDLTSDFIIE